MAAITRSLVVTLVVCSLQVIGASPTQQSESKPSADTAQQSKQPTIPNKPDDCGYFTQPNPPSGPAVPRDADNTFVFNHLDLKAENDAPYVLRVDDGAYFQILFRCTAPAFFNYTITGDAATSPDAAEGITLPESVTITTPLTTRGLTMRHDKRFLRYRVSARLREGLRQPTSGTGAVTPTAGTATPKPTVPTAPAAGKPAETTPGLPSGPQPVQLYSVQFDVWVVTKPEWKMGVIGGVAASSLTDGKYYIKPAADPTSTTSTPTFEEDTSAQEHVRVDVMALAHVYYSGTLWRTLNFGAAFGLGTSGTSPRFFFGPSVVFGKYFVFTPGIAIGSVTRAPIGQQIGQKPINDANSLNTLSTHVMARPYFGIGFTWIDRTNDFALALSSAASASGVVGSCVKSLTPPEVVFDEKGTETDITVDASDDCLWGASVASGGTWVKIETAVAKGKGTIKLTADSASKTATRVGTLNVTGPVGSTPKTTQLTQPPESCIESAPESVSFDGKTDAKPVVITTKEGRSCDWTASLEQSDAKFGATPPKGSGSQTITVTPPPQNTTDQTATLKVVGPSGAKAREVKLTQPKKAAADKH